MAAIHDMATELCAIAALACEATGEERGLRSALECVTEYIAALRRYDARELLRCPECGGGNLGAFHHEDMAWWQWTCIDCGTDGPWRNTQIEAILAWHKVTP